MKSLSAQLDEIFVLYEKFGSTCYEGEAVTQVEHALQAAELAEKEGASIPVVLGAFFHDIGHLVSMDKTTEERWALKNHGDVGKEFLANHGFPLGVTELVAGHVSAKRFLVYQDKDYYNKLSSHSRYTLKLQGGAMVKDEADLFKSSSSFNDIIRVRQWDEEAKDPEMQTKNLMYYRKMSESYLKNL
ncbi:2-amino-1-hydroxyethylphosphonate dioxygenase (glycine-forming)-like isoform X1 [Clavelina lepadiformis]|uniref:HD domain-containing protein n=1 Tax=Clavelina lepadiformis TaxID=159417 RepID=A0ABP0FY50_CLALP